jgi:hypothetical protein
LRLGAPYSVTYIRISSTDLPRSSESELRVTIQRRANASGWLLPADFLYVFTARRAEGQMSERSRIRLNADQRRARKTGQITEFVSAVGRKARSNGMDPNDRHFDPDFSKQLRRMPPEEFDRLFREDED